MDSRRVLRVPPSRGAAFAAACALLLTAAGCGSDDFENAPRPPAPVELTAKVDDKSVLMSPVEVGAGLVVITVSNQSDEEINLNLVGPGPEDNVESGEIPPGGVGNVKANVVEGEYEVNAGEDSKVRPARLEVGPERESSQNDLLLP